MLLREPPRDERTLEPGLGDAAWVMVGDLAGALQQAGIVSALLAVEPRPRCIVASGLSVANALLAARGGARRFERGWEELRSRRFVPQSALGSYRLLVAAEGFLDEVARKVGELGYAASNGRPAEASQILVASDEGFNALPSEPNVSGWRSAVKSAFRQPVSAPVLAAALRTASQLATRVIVLGADRPLQTHPDVDAARRLAAAGGIDVEFVTAATIEAPTLLEFILPGSGAAERLVSSGRSAAEVWLRARRSSQAPGGGGGDAGF
jgi:hypothetical protein